MAVEMEGLCQRGCGEPAPLARQTDTRLGYVKGQPQRFIKQHHNRVPEIRARIGAANTGERQSRWKGDEVGYSALHKWLRKHYPKTGDCEQCKRHTYNTDYALIMGRTYSRNREDYLELCPQCHADYDHHGENHPRALVTEDDVRAIRHRYAAGETQTGLGRAYGVSKYAIWAIVHRVNWAHVS